MFDAVGKRDFIVNNIKEWFDKNAPKASAVIGISGGKDSGVAAGLLVRALGPERVIGVTMPCGEQPDIDDSLRTIEALGIQRFDVNIKNAVEAVLNQLHYKIKLTDDCMVNIQPRIRMTALYAVAQCLPNGGIVINTCNRSEDYVGYATKFGDCAGDISILGSLLVSEVIAIGDTMEELPKDLVHKAPSDGLWGDTDEDRFGFTYDDIEAFIKNGTSGSAEIDAKIIKMNRTSRHKYNPMPVLSLEG